VTPGLRRCDVLRHYAYRQLPLCPQCGHHDHDNARCSEPVQARADWISSAGPQHQDLTPRTTCPCVGGEDDEEGD
jgi:hypothetical protein